MTIKEIKEAMDLVLVEPQVITPYIHGKPGVGKSAIIRQIAKARGISFIDLRLSQLESADIRGIPTPDLKLGSSRWLPPETIPFESFGDLYVPGNGDEKKFGDGGILLLDEFNRARWDVLQAAFQLVLDRRVGLHKLLDNWFLVCAGNLGEEDRTEVTEITDAALNNRFIHFYVDDAGMFDCWIEWAENEGNIHSDITGYLRTKPSNLYPDYKEEDVVFATPRSWEKFSRLIQQNPETDPSDITHRIGKNLIGSIAVSFLDYLRQKSKITPKELLNEYSKVKAKLEKFSRDEKYSLSNELVAYLKDHNKVNAKHLKNVHAFCMDHLEKDHMMAVYKTLVNTMIKYEGKEQEFMDPYLDMFPEMNEKIADMLYESKEDAK
jgi:hypothetical protein